MPEALPVIDALRLLLQSGLEADGRLPPERELSSTLRISRPQLREQLRALEVVGLLRRERARGTFFQPPAGTALGEILDLALVAERVSSRDLLVVRACLEREAARSATGRLDAQATVRLQELCAQMRNAQDSELALHADLEFHQLVFSSSGNSALSFFGSVLSKALERSLRDRRKVIQTDRQATLDMARAHDAVLQALRAQDPAAAGAAMDLHFAVYDRLARRVQQQPDGLTSQPQLRAFSPEPGTEIR